MTYRIISLAIGVLLTAWFVADGWPLWWIVLSVATDIWALWTIARDAAGGRP
jgi:hypothetical protein